MEDTISNQNNELADCRVEIKDKQADNDILRQDLTTQKSEMSSKVNIIKIIIFIYAKKANFL